MPYVKIPHDSANGVVRLRYNVHGLGPRKVVLISGMCVPSTMWIPQINALCSNFQSFSQKNDDEKAVREVGKYSVLTLDNRGVGGSTSIIPRNGASVPVMETLRGYSTLQMAHDVWEVVDAVGWKAEEVALVGHSMGGMVAQRMAYLRPQQVRMLGLLATHAGGWFDWWPSWSMLRGLGRALWNRFDKAAVTHVNLDWHYSERYLEEVVRKETENGIVIKRRDAYFERYMGTVVEDFEQMQVSDDNKEQRKEDVDSEEEEVEKVAVSAEKESAGSLLGHLKAAFGHKLEEEEARILRMCRKIRTIVMYGRDDGVIASSSSQTLANFLEADREVEVEGRHFIADESQHKINQVLIEELDKSFEPLDCKCESCVPVVSEDESE